MLRVSHLKNLHEFGTVAGNAEELHGHAVEECLVVVRVNARPPHVLEWVGRNGKKRKNKKEGYFNTCFYLV